jgi:hypothetical protein
MTEFAGVQSQDTINPNDPVYVDPMQWYYDMSQEQQEQYQSEKLALYRHVLEVTGLSGVASNTNWISPWNPSGMNPTVWNEYKRLTNIGLS